MKFLVVLVALVASVAAVSLSQEIEPLSPEHVEYINSLNTSWTAGHNFEGLKIHHLKRLCGTILEKEDEDTLSINLNEINLKALPANFDAREKWPECAETINHVRDQGSCGSCWAVATAGAVTDRVCIASKGAKREQLSEQSLISCCGNCYNFEGCAGGYPLEAYRYWLNTGLPTGGDYGSKQGCLPYQVEGCAHHVNKTGLKPCGDIVPTPKCQQTCSTPGVDFEGSKSYGKIAFRSGASIGEIQTELMKRGPMTAAFTVYDDFFLYKSGIYQTTEGAKPVGGHAVQVYGWGTSADGTRFWRAKNSWNNSWGNKGFFDIEVRAGSIHKGFFSGIPKI